MRLNQTKQHCTIFFDVKYNNVPFDGSLEIADCLMEAIEPILITIPKPGSNSRTLKYTAIPRYK